MWVCCDWFMIAGFDLYTLWKQQAHVVVTAAHNHVERALLSGMLLLNDDSIGLLSEMVEGVHMCTHDKDVHVNMKVVHLKEPNHYPLIKVYVSKLAHVIMEHLTHEINHDLTHFFAITTPSYVLNTYTLRVASYKAFSLHCDNHQNACKYSQHPLNKFF